MIEAGLSKMGQYAMAITDYAIVNNSLTAIRFQREQKLPPRRISTVGVVEKVPFTINTTIQTYIHVGAVRPSYNVGSMDVPNLTLVTSLEGVEQERFVWV
jgi:hypothetical protein